MIFRPIFVRFLIAFLLAMSHMYCGAQDNAGIVSRIDSLLVELSEAENDREKLELCNQLSSAYLERDADIGIEYANQAISLARHLQDFGQETEALLNKGKNLLSEQKDEDALESFRRALEVSEQNNLETGMARALYQISHAYYYLGEYSTAIEHANRSLETATRIGDPSIRTQALLTLGNCFRRQSEFEKALEKYEQALGISRENQDSKNVSRALSSIGLIYFNWGEFEKSTEYYQESYELRKESGDRYGMGVSLLRLANAYYYLAKYEVSLQNLQDALKIFQEIDFKGGIAAVYNLMAIIYEIQNFYDKALEMHQKKLEISEAMNDKREIATTFNNMGILYTKMASDSLAKLMGPEFRDSVKAVENDRFLRIFKKSLEFHHKSLELREELNEKQGIAQSLNNIGIAYLHSGKLNQALEYFQRSLEISRELGNDNEITNSLLRIGEIYKALGEYGKALDYLNQSLEIATQIGVRNTIKDIYALLSDVYSKQGNYKKALDYYKIHTNLKDSIFMKDRQEQISELQVQYETEVKERENELLRKDKALQETRIRQQRMAIFFFIMGFAVISVFVVLLIRQNNLRRKANRELAQKNALITEQKKEITDSIEYASRIQTAMLPPGDYIRNLLPERFILYMPRDIVSGDYYWITEKNGKVISVAADCTGHGVPGAFMSMLGIAFLNEIISKQREIHSDEILNELREHVIRSLHQTGKEGESQDGMDVAIFILDTKTNELEFSGANNPLFLIRDGELIEAKADKMPIGIHTRAKEPFTRHNLRVRNSDRIYTFSDGYPDQFGGAKGKKFMIKNFKQLLLNIHSKPMEEQKTILLDTLRDWMADTNQVDDILVMGIRI